MDLLAKTYVAVVSVYYRIGSTPYNIRMAWKNARRIECVQNDMFKTRP